MSNYLITKDLPYKKNDLDPVMNYKTLDYHYEHLAKNYAINYNNNKGDKKYNKAGYFLHDIFFQQLKKYDKKNDPHGSILEYINKYFNSFKDLKEKMKEEGLKIQGSGWVYLSNKDGEIKIIKNHKIKKDILILIDMWEHAFALQYQYRKADYLDDFWFLIDWNKINNKIDLINS